MFSRAVMKKSIYPCLNAPKISSLSLKKRSLHKQKAFFTMKLKFDVKDSHVPVTICLEET